jgi:hypothetical protein
MHCKTATGSRTPAHPRAPLCDNRVQVQSTTTRRGSPWNGGHRELLAEPTVYACERCHDDAFSPEPPIDVWKDIRNRGNLQKDDARTFENNRIFWAPKVAKRSQDLVSHNIYKLRFISENVELVAVLKILGRVDFETVPTFLRRRRKFCIKVGVIPESHPFLLDTIKVPQNLLKAWSVSDHIWHRNQILGATSTAWHPRFTTLG